MEVHGLSIIPSGESLYMNIFYAVKSNQVCSSGVENGVLQVWYLALLNLILTLISYCSVASNYAR